MCFWHTHKGKDEKYKLLFSPGHSRAGRVQRHERAVHAIRWGFPVGVLRDGEVQFWRDLQVPQTDIASEGQRRVSDAHGRE